MSQLLRAHVSLPEQTPLPMRLPKLIAEESKLRKLPSAQALYFALREWDNPEHPRLWPWIYRTHKADPPQEFVRNPY